MGGLISFGAKTPKKTSLPSPIPQQPSIETQKTEQEVTPELLRKRVEIISEEKKRLEETPCFEIYSQLTDCVVKSPEECEKMFLKYTNCVEKNKFEFEVRNKM